MKQLIAVLFLLGLAGCITTRAQLKQEQELNKLQVSKADSEAKFQDVEGQFRDLTGRIEVVEKKFDDTQKAMAKEDEDKKINQEMLDNKFKVIEEALLKIQNELNSMQADIDNLKKAQHKPKVSKSKKHKGNYSQAEADFSKKRWKQAIVGYQKYRELNPKGHKYADSTYKIGVCFSELKMNTEAKPFFVEVVQKFPKSKTAKKAQYRLKKLK